MTPRVPICNGRSSRKNAPKRVCRYKLPVLLLLMHAFGSSQVRPLNSLESLMLQFKDVEGVWDPACL